MKVALVHDWLVAHRGGEQVLLEIARLFPQAPIFTLVCRKKLIHPELAAHKIHTSWIQKLPLAPRRFRQYLPLFPAAIASFNLSKFDLVISTSHCVAKAVHTNKDQVHIAYVHSPMRYIWDQMPHYLAALPFTAITNPMAHILAKFLRRWDIRTSHQGQIIIANSEFVKNRIKRVWNLSVKVIYPPVDIDYFSTNQPAESRSGFIVVGALVPYKRIDLAVSLCSKRGFNLTVIGDGPELNKLKQIATSNIRFVKSLSLAELRNVYASAEALLFPGEEDFGIIPVEAMAAGCPVIAYGSGGSSETVIADGPLATGVLFNEQTLESLSNAVDKFFTLRASGSYVSEILQKHARNFDRDSFKSNFISLLSDQGLHLK
ncbi:MAG: glycosyltransferase [Deltaproteobacteria bacterium]|nr:glycosyltransferase [Deltaproteobacteria bacterium]